MLDFLVDDSRCTRCGQCVRDCPTQIIAQAGGTVPRIAPELEGNCLQCQHCLAVCPTAAISMLGKNPDNSLPVSARDLPRFEQMSRLLRARRSVRQYKDENVDPELIRQLLTAVANGPTGVNRRALTFTVIDDRAVMQRFRGQVLAAIEAAGAAGRLAERMQILRNAVPEYYQQGRDMIFRTAPHVLVVSAAPDARCPHEDVALALAYFELLAQSAGLGTVWCGLLKMTLEALPELKPLLGLAPDHHYYAMLFGVPAVHYARTVQRDDAAVLKRVPL